MPRIERLAAVLLVLVVSCSTASVAQAKTVDLPPGVIATVNGEPISEKQWSDTVKRVAGRGVLQFMIRHAIVHQAAKREGIALSEAELQAIFDKKIVEVGGPVKLKGYLDKIGETMVDFKERLHTETLLRRMAEKGASVTDEEIKQFFLERYGRKAEVQVIVAESQEMAKSAMKRIAAGEDFGQVALEISTDRTTAGNHGYIPAPLTEGIFPKPFGSILVTRQTAEQIFALGPGGVTGPVPGQRSDFYIFKLARLQAAKDVKFETVKEEIRRIAMEYKVQMRAAQLLREMLSEAVIETGI